MTQVGLWTLAVIPLFIAGILSSLKCGELAVDARYRRRSGRERTHGNGDNGRDGSGQRGSGGGEDSGIRRDQVSQDKTPPAKDAGAEYAEIWGEAVHTNRHLRTITVGLGLAVILLIVVVIRIASVDPPRPIVVRVDEVGRAEAVAYDVMEAQADPLDPTTKYFLNRFVYDFYSRRRATVEENWSRSLRFPHDRSSQRILPGREPEYRPPGGGRGPRRVAGGSCRFEDSSQPPGAPQRDGRF